MSRLDELEKLNAERTQRLWSDDNWCVRRFSEHDAWYAETPASHTESQARADAAFIAAMTNHATALLAVAKIAKIISQLEPVNNPEHYQVYMSTDVRNHLRQALAALEVAPQSRGGNV